jgi:hypothetical protein
MLLKRRSSAAMLKWLSKSTRVMQRRYELLGPSSERFDHFDPWNVMRRRERDEAEELLPRQEQLRSRPRK